MTAGRAGKRDIKRSETVPASRKAGGAPGMAAIIEASLLAAARRGNCANLAASSQGSTPSRASTESTLSGVSPLFFSILANKKLSNSGVRLETEAKFVISITGLLTIDQAIGSAERRGNLIYCATTPGARPGNYLRYGISKTVGRFDEYAQRKPRLQREPRVAWALLSRSNPGTALNNEDSGDNRGLEVRGETHSEFGATLPLFFKHLYGRDAPLAQPLWHRNVSRGLRG